MSRAHACRTLAGALVLALAAGCVSEDGPSRTPAATATPTAIATAVASPTATDTVAPTASPSPAATPEPTLSLDLPDARDDRRVQVSIVTDLPAEADGRITVTVTSSADTMITELVLRWPEALHETLFPAPFVPSQERIRDGGAPLVQPWTKWVIGPGERGEPAGTVSLGYGPLPAGGTLEIPLYVTRLAPGPIAFDLHVLAGEDLLALADGAPAALRVEVP
jgi:hypothetical protein